MFTPQTWVMAQKFNEILIPMVTQCVLNEPCGYTSIDLDCETFEHPNVVSCD